MDQGPQAKVIARATGVLGAGTIGVLEFRLMTDIGKILIGIGGLLVLVGVILLVAGRLHLPVGRLPGDLVYRGKHTTFYFPIVTSIVLSILLSLILWVIGRAGR